MFMRDKLGYFNTLYNVCGKINYIFKLEQLIFFGTNEKIKSQRDRSSTEKYHTKVLYCKKSFMIKTVIIKLLF